MKGIRMCCSRSTVMGTVGGVLLLLGLTQIVSGVYFLMTLPIFSIGSNIWTGAWTCAVGLLLTGTAYMNYVTTKGKVLLVALVSSLALNVANMVIVQIGEKDVFLDKDDLSIIISTNKDIAFRVAIWLTTGVTAAAIIVSFVGAQYLFCVLIRGPRVKGVMPVTRSLSEEDLHDRQVFERESSDPFGTHRLGNGMFLRQSSRVDRDVDVLSGGDGYVSMYETGGQAPSHAGNSLTSGGGSNSSSRGPDRRNGGRGCVNHDMVVGVDNPGADLGYNCEQASGRSTAARRSPPSTSEGPPPSAAEPCRSPPPPASKSAVAPPATPAVVPLSPGGSGVPYFLRNHKSTWQFILPEVVQEMKTTHHFSAYNGHVPSDSPVSMSPAPSVGFTPRDQGSTEAVGYHRRRSSISSFQSPSINGSKQTLNSIPMSVFSITSSNNNDPSPNFSRDPSPIQPSHPLFNHIMQAPRQVTFSPNIPPSKLEVRPPEPSGSPPPPYDFPSPTSTSSYPYSPSPSSSSTSPRQHHSRVQRPSHPPPKPPPPTHNLHTHLHTHNHMHTHNHTLCQNGWESCCVMNNPLDNRGYLVDLG